MEGWALTTRSYDRERDRDAVHRIWHEIGWIDRNIEDHRKGLDGFLSGGNVRVGLVDDEAECMVSTHLGTMAYLDDDLSLSVVSSVTVGRAGRKQGLATRMTADAVGQDAAEGAAVSALSMFEQGFYDRLGFGTGAYVPKISFDPANLMVDNSFRPPKRLTKDNWEEMHAARLRRLRTHGACCVTSPQITFMGLHCTHHGFGLGYYDGPGDTLSHFIWAGANDREHGPYAVIMIVYNDTEQLRELFAVISGLGDQVRLVRCVEPAHVQLQDFLSQPIMHRIATKDSKFASGISAMASVQTRICDLEPCISAVVLPCDDLTFNLALSDPIEGHLDDAAPWRGIAGDYIVTIGKSSGIDNGQDSTRPTLSASVNSFTRLWLGIQPATHLAVTNTLAGDRDLLDALDSAFRLPQPRTDWEF